MLNVVVLVGGMGVRLRPLSYELPKPLMPIAGRPALEHLLERLPPATVWLATGYGHQQFQEFASRFPNVRISHEHEPLGTGGAIANLGPQLSGDLLVINGDTFVDFNPQEFIQWHRQGAYFASILSVRVEDISRYGELHTQGSRLLEFREKSQVAAGPGLVNAGVYLLSQPPVCKPCSLERDCFPAWLAEGRPIGVFPCQGEFLDIGTPDTYLEAQQWALEGRLGIQLGPWKRPGQAVWIGPGSEIDPTAELLEPVVVGANSRVGPGSRLQRCVLWEHVSVGRGCRLSDCVLASGVSVPDGTCAAGLLEVRDSLKNRDS